MMLYMPTLVYSERECVKNHAEEIAMFGRKAMIVTGKYSSRANGSLEDVTDVLEKKGVEYIIFDDVEENPSIETVMKARNIGVMEGVDFVVGIGGGSPLDAAKAIAMMIANEDKDESVLYEAVPLKALPVLTVPTTAGTGSEVTPYSILTIHAKRTKKSISHKIYPVMALLDSKYLKTASQACIINTAVDALAHLVESYLNTNSNALNRTYSEKGLRSFAEVKEALLKFEITDEVYDKLMDIAMIAGIAITHTATSIPHGLSYQVTYELNVPHGKAVGMFLGGYVENYKDKEESKRVVEMLGFADAKAFRQYLNKLLGIVEVPENIMERNVMDLLSNKAKLKNYPFEITKEELMSMAN